MGDLKNREEALFGKVPPPPKKSFMANLGKEKDDKIKEFRGVVDSWKDGYDKHVQDFLSDATLFRYLDGFQWDINTANEKIKATAEWRQKERPQDIRLKDLKELGESGFIVHHGFDKYGRPIMYVNFGKDQLEVNEETNKLRKLAILYYVEKCTSRMPENVYQITWICDLKDANISLAMVKGLLPSMLLLGEHCAERLSVAIVCNASWTLSMCWSFASPFLNQQTLDRYTVTRESGEEVKAIITKYVDEDELLKGFGGKNDFKYDHKAIIALEEEQDKQQKE
ncbi:hypothetical protein AKO1_012990 [Acrasis kona]|uniref:CRAL-TRIO domain-containing protein n=1 Tax=Acrasis kona TaxID=1008807 RepID=A0AAW2YXT8_9EUKA